MRETGAERVSYDRSRTLPLAEPERERMESELLPREPRDSIAGKGEE